MALKVQQFLFVLISTFLAAIGVMFGGEAVNLFEMSWSTWTVLLSAVAIGFLNYWVMYLAPQNKNFGLGSKKGK